MPRSWVWRTGLPYRKSAKVFSVKNYFQAIRESFHLRKKPAVRYIYGEYLYCNLTCQILYVSQPVDPWIMREQLYEPPPQMMAVCLADSDHPASYDHILGQAFADFFRNDKPKPGKT